MMRRLPAIALLLSGAAAAGPAVWREPVTGMPFVSVPKGCFRMGTKTPLEVDDAVAFKHLPYKRSPSDDERPKHEVCVDAFFIGRYEVRADDWLKVMGTPPPQGSGDAPAAGVTWHEAREFARRLTQRSAGRHRFRLPTEAEWEYACRAGVKKDVVPYRHSELQFGWYSVDDDYIEAPSAVGKLKANAWGLHDMLGNVWEWVEDGYRADAYARHALYNPVTPADGSGQRVLRGGSHRSEYFHVRCASRGAYAADDALGQFGLRLVRQP